MTSECMYPQIEERLVPVHENHDYESDNVAERYDFTYRKWATKQEFMSLVRSLSALDLPSAQHIEDIQDISADDLKPIISLDHFSHGNNKTADVPELLVSNSPSPPDYPINRTTWGNADDIPTRVPSAALEDFPPLVRCRDGPAMGYSDDYIMDMDESVLSNLSFSFLLNADYDEHDENASNTKGESPDSSLSSSCKESTFSVAESKEILQPPCTDTLHWHEREPSGT